MPSPQLQLDFAATDFAYAAPQAENNVIQLPVSEEVYAPLPERGIAEPYLKWVEACTKNPDLLRSLQKHLGGRLHELGCEDKIQPDSKDVEEVYLMKASLGYAAYCASIESPKNFRAWTMTEGTVWERNDARTQTLTKALNHAYTPATAKAEGKPVLSQNEAIRFSQQQAVQYGMPRLPGL